MNEFDNENNDEQKVASADSSRRAAKWFNYGTIIAVLVPVPLGQLEKPHPSPTPSGKIRFI